MKEDWLLNGDENSKTKEMLLSQFKCETAYYFGWQSVQILFLSMILHSLGDLPVHNDDAHRHFFPFSNYRFISPFSYWDRNHYGSIVSLVEMLLVLLSTFRVFGFVNSYFGKGLLILVNGFYSIGALLFYIRSLVYRYSLPAQRV